MPPIKNYQQLLAAATTVGPVPVVVAAAHEYEVLQAVCAAQTKGIIHAMLVGQAQIIHQIAQQHGLNLGAMDIVDEVDETQAAVKAMRLVSQGKAKVAIKGQVQTSIFLRAALAREVGLRTNRLISHVGVFEVPGFDRLLFISDGGVVLYPTKEQKIEIISNSIAVARGFGVKQPKVALLAAADEVIAELPVTLEIAEIVAMQERWLAEGALVDGPFLLDTAVSALMWSP